MNKNHNKEILSQLKYDPILEELKSSIHNFSQKVYELGYNETDSFNVLKNILHQELKIKQIHLTEKSKSTDYLNRSAANHSRSSAALKNRPSSSREQSFEDLYSKYIDNHTLYEEDQKKALSQISDFGTTSEGRAFSKLEKANMKLVEKKIEPGPGSYEPVHTPKIAHNGYAYGKAEKGIVFHIPYSPGPGAHKPSRKNLYKRQ